MINFPPLRTRRLTVQLRELSIGESIALAAMPEQLNEALTTAFLRKIATITNGIEDPAHWTTQERILAVCHYLASVSEDGPDFSMGSGHYSDYLDGAADISTAMNTVPAGELSGDVWTIRHLTGAMAESIERAQGEIEGITGRLHWILGAMAAQLVREGEDVPDGTSDEGAFDEFLISRMRVFAEFPESDFQVLMSMYFEHRQKLHHLFKIDFSSDGIVSMPKGGAASDLPPARFPVYSCLSQMARDLGGKPSESGIQP